MAKNPNDKYYTQESEVKKVMEILLKFIPKESITEIIEPAAGDGAFIEEIKKLGIPYKFYDLIPEHPEIEQKDFKDLMKEMEYKKGRVFVGNPPFGNASSLFKRFRNGAMEKGDWAVYIGPASHWNMKWGLKGMELVYSEHLGGVEYRGLENKKVNTCVNVYKRISGNIVDRRMEMLERDFEIWSRGRNGFDRTEKVDFLLIQMGDKNIGILDMEQKYNRHICINVLDKKLFEKTKIFCEDFNKKYSEEIINKSTGLKGIAVDWLKQKMIEEFYPTREEMLERDFEIKSWAEDGYDFYIRGMDSNSKNIGKDIADFSYNFKVKPSIGIKVKNNLLKDKTESFCKEFKKKNIEEIKKLSPNNTWININWFKQKMIEEFYSDVPEYFEHTYIEEKKEHAKELF